MPASAIGALAPANGRFSARRSSRYLTPLASISTCQAIPLNSPKPVMPQCVPVRTAVATRVGRGMDSFHYPLPCPRCPHGCLQQPGRGPWLWTDYSLAGSWPRDLDRLQD
ncbi:hypothetical protein BO78DRAFT_72875 [Aspergillus sclerotiicarbonarius CBS 121057]|uniref:Uncharacterized protein n=1 Tax=Aspergillus sclerotiicarbonarius (strain CBS 121057 / IBT 28362) TaxID=1448318 RepID=A0A319EE37_ASPSB|nr:hypothetical protein BO78DRAFT_72875 [Aspergillus sclerotiicarbonarius CBS 121057]